MTLTWLHFVFLFLMYTRCTGVATKVLSYIYLSLCEDSISSLLDSPEAKEKFEELSQKGTGSTGIVPQEEWRKLKEEIEKSLISSISGHLLWFFLLGAIFIWDFDLLAVTKAAVLVSLLALGCVMSTFIRKDNRKLFLNILQNIKTYFTKKKEDATCNK